MACATLVGYGLSEPLRAEDHQHDVHVLQALVIGTIIHSLIHRGHAHKSADGHDGTEH